MYVQSVGHRKDTRFREVTFSKTVQHPCCSVIAVSAGNRKTQGWAYQTKPEVCPEQPCSSQLAGKKVFKASTSNQNIQKVIFSLMILPRPSTSRSFLRKHLHPGSHIERPPLNFACTKSFLNSAALWATSVFWSDKFHTGITQWNYTVWKVFCFEI